MIGAYKSASIKFLKGGYLNYLYAKNYKFCQIYTLRPKFCTKIPHCLTCSVKAIHKVTIIEYFVLPRLYYDNDNFIDPMSP